MARMAANMRRRENGGYELRFYVDGKRYSVYGATTKECKEKEATRRKEIEAGLYAKNRNVTLDAYFREWLAHKEKSVSAVRAHNIESYYRLYFSPVLGKRKVKDIERRELVAIQDNLGEKLKVSTINNVMAVISMILKSAVADEIVIKNVASNLPRIKDKNAKPARENVHRAMNKQEIAIIFKYLKQSQYYNIFRLMINTGMRPGEACGLQWRDIDWKNNVIHIKRTVTRNRDGKWIVGNTTKTKKGIRDIPMNEEIFSILRDTRRIFEETHGKACIIDMNAQVFKNSRGFVATNNVENALACALKRAEKAGEAIPKIGAHAFRATFASMAAANGMPMNTLKEILGHESYAMTCDLYCHVYEDEKKKAMAALKFAAM